MMMAKGIFHIDSVSCSLLTLTLEVTNGSWDNTAVELRAGSSEGSWSPRYL